MATRLTRLAIDLARLVTPLAALFTALREGSETLRALDVRLLAPRFADDFFFAGAERLEDARLGAPRFAEARFGALFRAEDFFALDLRAAFFRVPLLRADDLRADDLRGAAFFPLDFFLEPPRDDFLAAAMIRAPIIEVQLHTIATSAHKQ